MKNDSLPDSLVNINGEIHLPQDAKISVFDRGLLFGDSIYEVTYASDQVVLFAQEHLDRFWNSAQLIQLELPYTQEEIMREIHKTLQRTSWASSYIRLIATRGVGEVNLHPRWATRPNLIIIVKEFNPPPAWVYEKGVEVAISPIHRNSQKSLDPNIKSGNYLNNILALLSTQHRDPYEVLMLNHLGKVAEGSTSNFWKIKGEVISTPPVSTGILRGITRDKVLQLARDLDLQVEERDFEVGEVLDADECFLTSSTRQIVPVTSLSDQQESHKIGHGRPGPMTLDLLKHYREMVENYKRNYPFSGL